MERRWRWRVSDPGEEGGAGDGEVWRSGAEPVQLLVDRTINPMLKYQQQEVTLIEQHSLTAMAQRAG